MTWGGDGWNWWIRGDRYDRPGVAEPFEVLREILVGVPGRETKAVVHVGRAGPACLQFLSAHFSAVTVIDTVRPAGHRFDVVLAVDGLARPETEELDALLERVRGLVVEGGLLLATFPAARRESVAREMRLRDGGSRPASPRLHEMELQYRLRRAGFRGVRIRRILEDTGAPEERGESLLCIAARRANN